MRSVQELKLTCTDLRKKPTSLAFRVRHGLCLLLKATPQGLETRTKTPANFDIENQNTTKSTTFANIIELLENLNEAELAQIHELALGFTSKSNRSV